MVVCVSENGYIYTTETWMEDIARITPEDGDPNEKRPW